MQQHDPAAVPMELEQRAEPPRPAEVGLKRKRSSSPAGGPQTRRRDQRAAGDAGQAPAVAGGAAAPATTAAKPKPRPSSAATAVEAAEAAAARAGQLTEAYAQFEAGREQRRLCLEVDLAARLGSVAMVGRQVWVWWPDDVQFYAGKITKYDVKTGLHTVHYDDGTTEKLVIALERVLLIMHAGEQLGPPEHASLLSYSLKLRELTSHKEWGKRGKELRRRAEELARLAAELAPAQEAQSVQQLAQRAAQVTAKAELQAAAAGKNRLRGSAGKAAVAAATAALAAAGGLLAVRSPSVAAALALAARLPGKRALPGVRVRDNVRAPTAYTIRVNVPGHTKLEVAVKDFAAAAVAVDVYALYKRVVLGKAQEGHSWVVSGVDYASDATLVEQLRSVGNSPERLRSWLQHVLGDSAAEAGEQQQQAQPQEAQRQEAQPQEAQEQEAEPMEEAKGEQQQQQDGPAPGSAAGLVGLQAVGQVQHGQEAADSPKRQAGEADDAEMEGQQGPQLEAGGPQQQQQEQAVKEEPALPSGQLELSLKDEQMGEQPAAADEQQGDAGASDQRSQQEATTAADPASRSSPSCTGDAGASCNLDGAASAGAASAGGALLPGSRQQSVAALAAAAPAVQPSDSGQLPAGSQQAGGQQAGQASAQPSGPEQQQQAEQQQEAEQQPGQPVLLPGDVGWFQVAGYPHWPFMVVTREEATARGLSAAKLGDESRGFLAAQYFGMGDVGAVNPRSGQVSGRKAAAKPNFATFLEGLERGYHRVDRCRRPQEFKRALFEVEQYLKAGELPAVMAPQHLLYNQDLMDEDEEEGGPEEPPAKKHKGKGGQGQRKADAGKGPRKLQVVEWGEVEWLHPGFHNAKYIFPPGYRAIRLAKTPASGNKEAPHVLEVLRAPDGSGPVFRVTPEGCPAVEGSDATKAWQALFAGDTSRLVGISGEQMFGLAAPFIQRHIRELPNASRCQDYLGWPEGEQPLAPPLTEAEQRERLACEARMQKLAVPGVPVQYSGTGLCHVCNEEDEDEEDHIVQCGRCNVFVHMSCYGISSAPLGEAWLCDPCSLGLKQPPPCALCPVLGGALKRTACDRWAHPTCAQWLPEPYLDWDKGLLHMTGVIREVEKVHPTRRQLVCGVCRQKHGACFQCCERKCMAAFHPLCARQAGFRMEMAFDSDDEEEEQQAGPASAEGLAQPAGAEQASAAGPAAAGQQQSGEQQAEQDTSARAAGGQQQQQEASGPADGQLGQSGCREGSCDENDAAAPNSTAHGEGSSKRGGAGAAANGRKKAHRRAEGTRRGNVCFLAYCAKHSQADRPAAAAARQQAAPAQQGAAAPPQQQQQPVQPPPPSHFGSARAVPYNHASRRGQRAPEAVAAAEAKRGFVRSTPYLVGGPLRQGLAEVPASRRLTPPPGAGGQYAGAESGEAMQVEAAACPQQQQQVHPGLAAAAGEGGASTPQPPPLRLQPGAADGGETLLPPWSPRLRPGGAVERPDSPPAGQARVGLSPTRHIQSDAARFHEMLASQGRRVAIGKSGIHGWGAFAKCEHAAHDMVIEYVGELVRPSVSDLRERRMYDDMVGAGTYVFRLNRALCVDATRAGNLAHMLNHSCQPNCYSRTISLTEPGGRRVDHVIIFAKRDIAVGEELTYDYRFCGEEQLPCNCGAPRCRGRVNEKPPSHDRLLAPRTKLRWYRPPALAGAAAQPAQGAGGGGSSDAGGSNGGGHAAGPAAAQHPVQLAPAAPAQELPHMAPAAVQQEPAAGSGAKQPKAAAVGAAQLPAAGPPGQQVAAAEPGAGSAEPAAVVAVAASEPAEAGAAVEMAWQPAAAAAGEGEEQQQQQQAELLQGPSAAAGGPAPWLQAQQEEEAGGPGSCGTADQGGMVARGAEQPPPAAGVEQPGA